MGSLLLHVGGGGATRRGSVVSFALLRSLGLNRDGRLRAGGRRGERRRGVERRRILNWVGHRLDCRRWARAMAGSRREA